MWKLIVLDILRPLYIIVTILLSLYSTFLLSMVILFWRKKWMQRRSAGRRNESPEVLDDECLPVVAVQLPLYNEKDIALRVIDAVTQLDYPRHKLHIQVLDDSSDETYAMVMERVAHWQSQGFWITHHHRTDRSEYKAGALKAGMQQTPANFIAVFDADFLPPPTWLKDTLHPFMQPAAEKLGFVQTRWTHLNEDYSLVTQSQALGLDSVFGVEQPVCAEYGFFNFLNGTGMLLRRQAVDEAGGWRGDTLVEDMDLCLRIQLKGWKGTFLRDVTAPAELPGIMASYKLQQFRWAKGSMQVANLFTLPILRQPLRFGTRATVLFHSLGHLINPLLLLLLAMALPLYSWSNWWLDHLPFRYLSIMGIGYPLFLATAHITLYPRKDWWKLLVRLPMLSLLGLGMSANNTLAVIEGLARKKSAFQRTPKLGVKKGDRLTLTNVPVRVRISPTNWLEVTLALYALAASITTFQAGKYVAGYFFAMYVLGYSWVAGAELLENIAARRVARKHHEP